MTDQTLPPLPSASMTYERTPAGSEPERVPVFTAEQMRAYAHASIEQVLTRSGQYLTNDASREAAIAEAVSAAQAQLAWRPIETAPRDGSDVLLFEVYERLPVIGWWSEKKKRWYATTEVYDTDGDACVIDKLYTEGVTHWMPLPAAPVQSPRLSPSL